VDGDVSGQVRAAIEADVARGAPSQPEAFVRNARQVERAIHGAVRLTMALPVYQLS
jgi:hypothetical protein